LAGVATLLIDLCRVIEAAEADGKLTKSQRNLAKQALVALLPEPEAKKRGPYKKRVA